MSKPVYRVALLGPAGSGKSSQAKLLQKALGGDVLSFAAPMRKQLRELFGDKMDDPDFYRRAMQAYGTDFARKLDEDVWVRQLLKKLPATRNVFIDDCRFHNEYRALEERGFMFVRLATKPEELQRRRPDLTAVQAQHASELEQAQFPAGYTVRTDPALIPVLAGLDSDEYEFVREAQEESIQRVHEDVLKIVTTVMPIVAEVYGAAPVA